MLCELDGTLYHRPFAAFRLLPYVSRRAIPLPPIADFVDLPSRLEEMARDDDAADNGMGAGDPSLTNGDILEQDAGDAFADEIDE